MKTYRAAAERLITGVVGRAIEEATPEIQQSAVLTAITAAETQIKAHVTTRTDFGSALLTNIVAWVITLAIAALVLILASRPSVEQTVASAANKVSGGKPAIPEGQKR